jgi:hypothetical protein
MHDELLARHPPLVGVVLAGEYERLRDALAVDGLGDLVGVLLDDREQVREQVLLEAREVGRDRAARLGVRRGMVDRRVAGDRDGALRRAAGDRRLLVAAAYAAIGIGELVRYRRPSSRRRW